MRFRLAQNPEVEDEAILAVTQSILFSGCLWWFTWVHFLIKLLYGFPLISRPNMALAYYETVPGYPFSLAQTFLMLSIFGSSLAVIGVWFTSLKGRAKWRQRFLVFLFGFICSGFSCACISWEDQHIDDTKAWRQFLIDHRESRCIGEPPEIQAQRWKHLDDMLERAEERNN